MGNVKESRINIQFSSLFLFIVFIFFVSKIGVIVTYEYFQLVKMTMGNLI